MKIFHGLLLVVVMGLIILSCSKDKTVTPIADANGAILAGAKGSSKNWKISSATGTQNGGSPVTLSLDACFIDNIYKFTNNATQDFQHTEGSTKCVSTDSTLVEEGSWAFTSDGKKLLFDGAAYSQQNLFTTLGRPVTVEEITESTMRLSFSYTDSGNVYVIYLNFVKV